MSTGLPQFFRTDAPAVRDAGVDESNCSSCSFWSRWLPETGDCLLYALQQRQAIIAGATSAEVPPKSARTTSAGETCDGWEARHGI